MSVAYAIILLHQQRKVKQMSNIMRIPHTVVFEALINLDTIPASLLPRLTALDKETITEMCKESTIHALGLSNLLSVANDGNTWAEVVIAE